MKKLYRQARKYERAFIKRYINAELQRERYECGINIRRLIDAWETFRISNPYEICLGKEFRALREPDYCMGQMIEDTLKLLERMDKTE